MTFKDLKMTFKMASNGRINEVKLWSFSNGNLYVRLLGALELREWYWSLHWWRDKRTLKKILLLWETFLNAYLGRLLHLGFNTGIWIFGLIFQNFRAFIFVTQIKVLSRLSSTKIGKSTFKKPERLSGKFAASAKNGAWAIYP